MTHRTARNIAGQRARIAATQVPAIAAVVACFVNVAAAAGQPPPGASSCSGCHGGGAVVALKGREPAEITRALSEFRERRRPATVMDRIARGFSANESTAIAEWYGAQRK